MILGQDLGVVYVISYRRIRALNEVIEKSPNPKA